MMRCISLAIAVACAAQLACAPSAGPLSASRPPVARQWFEREKASYRAADFDDARDAAQRALAAAPNDPEIRVLSARVALVRLDYADALRLTEGIDSTEAHSIRGRAFWFSGDLEHAADELDAMLTDPTVKEPWARDVAGLARRGGGRHPFEMAGGLVGSVDMPPALDRVSFGAASVVPCELDGERILALVATGSSEVVLDSNSRHEPAWVSLRFDRVEIKDVPALVQDLAPITRQLGVPIRALLGAQLLRHGHVTLDRRGDQFVVRRQDAAAPPEASRVPLYYLRGGGMLLRAALTSGGDAPRPFLVDSSKPFPLLLQDDGWRSVGVDPHTLVPVTDSPNTRRGVVPTFRIGGFDLAKVPALSGSDLSESMTGIDVDLAGVVGADILSFFRITFADDGRFIWIEPDPLLFGSAAPAQPAQTNPAPSPSGTLPAAPTTKGHP